MRAESTDFNIQPVHATGAYLGGERMKLSALIAALGIAVSSSAATADPVNLTLSGGNPGGLWSLLGAGIDRAAKADDSDSVITYQATGGGFANIGLLGGKCQ